MLCCQSPNSSPSWSSTRNSSTKRSWEGKFIASGVVFIPVGGEKPTKPSRDNAYVSISAADCADLMQVFYVIEGTVKVTIHMTSFICGAGGQFLIPRGK